MWTIRRLADADTDVVATHDGFLSCIIYSSAHSRFREAILSKWKAFDRWSGKALLMLVADEGKELTAHPLSKPDLSSLVQMMVRIPRIEDEDLDDVNVEIARHFQIKRAYLPCIVFFDGVSDPTTIIYRFLPSDDIVENMMKIFDDCQQVWVHCESQNVDDLRKHRGNMMNQLEPLLNKRKFIRLVKNISRHPSFAALLSMIPKLS